MTECKEEGCFYKTFGNKCRFDGSYCWYWREWYPKHALELIIKKLKGVINWLK
jgi:hypothetical protein